MAQKGKIMIADDDPAIVDALQILLEDEGYLVTATVNGDKVSKMSNGSRPDLLLLDIWMSGVNGGDVCKQLKCQDTTKDIPVIMISANRDTEMIARQSGADDFLLKPFDIDDLLKKIEKYLKTN